jgi:long-chain acyl-CoA synthetase
MRPLVWLLAAPALSRRGELRSQQRPLLLIANHVTVFDAPLVLYALPSPMRRNIAIAMSGEMLEDWRHARNQGNLLLNLLAPVEYFLVTALFNVFPLPSGAGFRRSFAYAGEAMDRGYHVLVFPEGRRSDDGVLQPFRSGIGLLARESAASILPIGLKGLGELKQRKRRWFRSRILQVRIGELLEPNPQLAPEDLAESFHKAHSALLQ